MSSMVTAAPPAGPNAPWVRCSQLSSGCTQPRNEFGRHALGGLAKVPVRSASRQLPQKTCDCVPEARDWLVAGPVVICARSGMVPISSEGDGGQSLLVGYASPRSVLGGVHAPPFFAP